jgi:hypothetical protein
MSVVVVVEGIRDIPESAYRSDIESKLKAAGITVLPPTVDPHTYPFLGLVVTASFIRSQNNNLLGSLVVCQLQFDQLIPATVGSQPKYVRAITWESDSNYAFGPSIGIVSQLRELYRGMIDEFVRQYKTANIR